MVQGRAAAPQRALAPRDDLQIPRVAGDAPLARHRQPARPAARPLPVRAQPRGHSRAGHGRRHHAKRTCRPKALRRHVERASQQAVGSAARAGLAVRCQPLHTTVRGPGAAARGPWSTTPPCAEHRVDMSHHGIIRGLMPPASARAWRVHTEVAGGTPVDKVGCELAPQHDTKLIHGS